MKLILWFDIEQDAVYIPDGYVSGVHELQRDFFKWADEEAETFVLSPEKLLCKRYTCDLFLRYVNEILLAECNEIAYRIEMPTHIDKLTRIMRF